MVWPTFTHHPHHRLGGYSIKAHKWTESDYQWQVRILTGFHRFLEIGQIFHNEHTFNNNKTSLVEIWKMVWTNVFFFAV